MRVLMVTGDKSLLMPGTPGFSRLELQRGVVEELVVMYWGRGNLWPKLPKGHFDVVTVQDPFWRGSFAWKVARRLKAPLNVQVHTDLSAQSLVRHILAQIILRHAKSIRVVSEKIKKQVESIGVRGKISVLPIFVDTPRFSSVIRRPHASKNILWIGRFEEEKNPLQAIEILKKELKNIPDAQLKMLGSGTYGEKISKAAANLPVQTLGWQDPLLHLDIADVVLCTSWHESWGASIVEALAAGVPVVAPDVGIAREAGAIVVSREGLAEAVIKALQSNANGELKLHLSTREEWARKWKDSLII